MPSSAPYDVNDPTLGLGGGRGDDIRDALGHWADDAPRSVGREGGGAKAGWSTTRPGVPVAPGAPVLWPQLVWKTELVPGAQQASKRGRSVAKQRGNSFAARLHVGDLVRVTARFGPVADARGGGVAVSAEQRLAKDAKGGMNVSSAWTGPNDYLIILDATRAGTARVEIDVDVPGMESQPFDFNAEIVNDARGFADRCNQAQTYLAQQYAAARALVYAATQHYKAAYDKHVQLLEAKRARDRLKHDLLLSIILAPLAGLAGGTVGGALKPFADNLHKLQTIRANIQAAIVTDSAKDLTKVLARSVVRAPSQGASSESKADGMRAGSGRSTGRTGKGSSAAAGEDPLSWLTRVHGELSLEESDAYAMLLDLQETVHWELSTGTAMDHEVDPMTLVSELCTVDGASLGEFGTPPEETDFLKALWATWLSEYAWKMTESRNRSYGEYWTTHHVTSNMDGDLEDAIRDVARNMGEDGDAWLQQFGGQSKQRATDQAAERKRSMKP